MNERLNEDELKELMNEGQTQQIEEMNSVFGNVKVVPIPAIIYVMMGDELAGFDAKAAGSWAYTPLGIFATGAWIVDSEDEQPIRDVLLPYESVHHLEFAFPDPPEVDEEDGKDTSD